MSKSKRARPRTARPASNTRSKATGRKSIVVHRHRGNSKQERVLGLLQASSGATIEKISQVTGWQSHSVRGFLAGVVRKKLGLTLQSEKIDGERVYRIVGGPTAAKSAASSGT
jgi:hypothetical protein